MAATHHVRILFGFLAIGVAAPARPAPFLASQFPARMLAAHNAERRRIGVAPLVWDSALGTAAAVYAVRMASTGRFEHSDRAARRGVGENLWYGTHGAFSMEAMVSAWASEKRMFVPGLFPNVSRTGNWADVAHYTQIIWPATQRIGCALASTIRADYLVCRYAPAGNVDGRPVGYRILRRR